jgi:hypothetical protein
MVRRMMIVSEYETGIYLELVEIRKLLERLTIAHELHFKKWDIKNEMLSDEQ